MLTVFNTKKGLNLLISYTHIPFSQVLPLFERLPTRRISWTVESFQILIQSQSTYLSLKILLLWGSRQISAFPAIIFVHLCAVCTKSLRCVGSVKLYLHPMCLQVSYLMVGDVCFRLKRLNGTRYCETLLKRTNHSSVRCYNTKNRPRAKLRPKCWW